MPHGSLVLERPKRQVKGTTRYDPDIATNVPQMGGRTIAPPGRRKHEGEGSSSLRSWTPPPPSPRAAAAGAALMGASRDATSSPIRMSPRLASRVTQAGVPACDALLLLGAAGAL